MELVTPGVPPVRLERADASRLLEGSVCDLFEASKAVLSTAASSKVCVFAKVGGSCYPPCWVDESQLSVSPLWRCIPGCSSPAAADADAVVVTLFFIDTKVAVAPKDTSDGLPAPASNQIPSSDAFESKTVAKEEPRTFKDVTRGRVFSQEDLRVMMETSERKMANATSFLTSVS
jgi:hypothetical protein